MSVNVIKKFYLYLQTQKKSTALQQSTSFDVLLVEVTGFEPAASASRTQRSTKLSHTSKSAPFWGYLWLRKKDSNPHKQSQSLPCYHYTIPQYLNWNSRNNYIKNT